MKTRFLVLPAIISIVLFSSCSLIEDIIKIPIKITDEFTVPPLTGINTVVAPVTKDSSTDIEQQMSINDSRKDKIKSIKLKKCVLTIQNSNTDFSFVNDLQVYLNAEGQEEVLIATAMDIDPDATSLDMDVHSTDLSAYLKQDKVSFKTIVENKEVVLNSIDIEIETKFQITADIFKK